MWVEAALDFRRWDELAAAVLVQYPIGDAVLCFLYHRLIVWHFLVIWSLWIQAYCCEQFKLSCLWIVVIGHLISAQIEVKRYFAVFLYKYTLFIIKCEFQDQNFWKFLHKQTYFPTPGPAVFALLAFDIARSWFCVKQLMQTVAYTLSSIDSRNQMFLLRFNNVTILARLYT